MTDEEINEKFKHVIIKVALIAAMIAMCFADSFAQPFAGLNLTNKGIGANMGFLIHNTVEVTANYKSLTNRNDVPKVLSLSAGLRVLLTRNELNNWSVTPSIGVGNYRLKDFSGYYADPTGKTGIKQISQYKPIVGVNLSKDAYMGQMFLSIDYCNKITFYGAGIRFYLYRRLVPQD